MQQSANRNDTTVWIISCCVFIEICEPAEEFLITRFILNIAKEINAALMKKIAQITNKKNFFTWIGRSVLPWPADLDFEPGTPVM